MRSIQVTLASRGSTRVIQVQQSMMFPYSSLKKYP
jgi:hypothetical protein